MTNSNLRMLKQKQTLIAENNKRKDIVASLDKKLDEWIESGEAIEKEFGVCNEEMGKVGVARDAALRAKEDGLGVNS